jgi:alkylation response protein AidB-like acyl-CoA dehydrogenase
MELLKQERLTLERYLPGLDGTLANKPLLELESPGSIGIRSFCEAGGPALLLPSNFAGLGATALDAIQIQRAIASRSPSLAIAATMHHYSIASLVEIAALIPGLEASLLEPVARQRLLVASGFAEGQSGRGTLSPMMKAERVEGGWIVSGSKKPCSLTWSMDLLAASVALPSKSKGGVELGIVIIPAKSEGIERRKFWGNWILAGAESDEVVLQNVFVPDELVINLGDTSVLDPLQMSGLIWFEMLITASYLGVATALAERVIAEKRGGPSDRALLAIELEGAMSALVGLALTMASDRPELNMAAQALLVRYAVERAVERASASAVELLGGMAFIQNPEISYLFATSRVLAFHPPSRISMSDPLADYLVNGSLRIM